MRVRWSVRRERERVLTQIKSIFQGEGKEYTLLIWQRVCMARCIGRLRYFSLSKTDAKKWGRKAELRKQALVPKNRPIRKICPVLALGGFALFLSFSSVFRTGSPSCKPRCLVYKAARARTDKKSINHADGYSVLHCLLRLNRWICTHS